VLRAHGGGTRDSARTAAAALLAAPPSLSLLVRLGQFGWCCDANHIRPLRAPRTLRFRAVTIKST